jgi:DNA polymerase III epsilon subunit-like protein
MFAESVDRYDGSVAARADVYISADVETDGPIPGPFSLLSFGLCVAGTFDGTSYEAAEPEERTFYRELRPISGDYQPEALAVNGLDREMLLRRGADPREAMEEADQWVRSVAGDRRPVLVAYPVAFDWAFLYWYFVRFAEGGSPFGYSSCLDIRTLYQAKAHTVFDRSSKRFMPTALIPDRPHTHNALDDAVEQAQLFNNVFAWTVASHATSR